MVEENVKFKVWMTIKLGTSLRTGDDFRSVLKAGGFFVDNYADYILNMSTSRLAEEIEVNLVYATLEELGLKGGVSLYEIYQQAKSLGWELCPAEVGPLLRLQCENQQEEESYLIGMEPIEGPVGNPYSIGDPYIFFIYRDKDSNLCLGSSECPRGAIYTVSHTCGRWVFIQPR